jgi:hypothetical protein
MGRRVLPVVIVLLAALADGRGRHGLGTSLLVLAIPAAAASALTRFGELVQLPGRVRGVAAVRADVALGVVALVAVVVAAAARGGMVEDAAVPPLAVSAVVASVTAFALQAFVALLVPVDRVERPARRRAVPADEPAQAA